ncbi:MAG: hypothetical protein ACJA16_005568 [Akkermansiaceae bacterium]
MFSSAITAKLPRDPFFDDVKEFETDRERLDFFVFLSIG